MAKTEQKRQWQVLIASSHPLFAEGIRGLLNTRQQADVEVVGVVSTIDEALDALNLLKPDMVIVDYDDDRVNREEFLARFVESEGRLRVILLSLKEGGQEAIVYDRRTMAASQIDVWLDNWTETDESLADQGNARGDGEENNQKPKRRDGMRHFIAAALVVIVLTALGLFALEKVDLLPSQSSLQALPIDNLFSLQLKIIAFLFALIVGLMIYSIIVFRRKKGDDTDAAHIEGNTRLEVFWTLVPLVTVLYLSYIGAQALGAVGREDPFPLQVNVIGSQWSWRFEYPEYDIISTDLMLPVNKQALLRLSSTDVIHSFWVPEFRVKQDVLPSGEKFVRELNITPSELGTYKVRCAEMCGSLHYDMRAPVVVMTQDAFDTWVEVESGGVSGDPAERGKTLAEQFGCTACHSADGTPGVGPTWTGLFGSQESLEDGGSVLVDHAFLYESILEPGAKITDGFQNIMPPNIGADLSDEQINDIIAYIESLQ